MRARHPDAFNGYSALTVVEKVKASGSFGEFAVRWHPADGEQVRSDPDDAVRPSVSLTPDPVDAPQTFLLVLGYGFGDDHPRILRRRVDESFPGHAGRGAGNQRHDRAGQPIQGSWQARLRADPLSAAFSSKAYTGSRHSTNLPATSCRMFSGWKIFSGFGAEKQIQASGLGGSTSETAAM